MLQRQLELPPRHVYPPDEWRLVEREFYPRRMAQFETLFSTSNGYLGIRGAHEEGEPAFQNATLISGFHETWPIAHAEEAYGFAKTGQTLVNAPDAKRMRLYVDDEPFSLRHANLKGYERVLDMRTGILHREILWELASGKLVSIKSRRLVSLEHRHLAALEYEVTVLNADVPVVISSELVYEPHDSLPESADPRVARAFDGRVMHCRLQRSRGPRLVMGYETERSGMTLGCAVDHVISSERRARTETREREDHSRVIISVDVRAGESVRVTKFMSYHSSRTSPADELCERTERTLDRAMTGGFEALCEGQRRFVQAFWERSDIQVRGKPDADISSEVLGSWEQSQQVLRVNLFHILQATARAEGVGVPAKGLTGMGYEGHYFWDTEIYVLPFLIYTEPRIAKNLLQHRFGLLEHARERARELSQKGALFAWRTINGEEASAYYAAGTAQYHINADIVYALRKYVEATGDEAFLYESGAEVLVETARLWRDLGFFSEQRDGRFCIVGVTGPDEYNTVVNNNTFTNLMARENLWFAAQVVERMRTDEHERYESLIHRTGLVESEVDEWRRAADRMFLPYDEDAGIHIQDDHFPFRKPWDFENTPPEKYPLLLHYHPLEIYRHRVIKQADVVLAMFLLGDEFSLEEKRRNFDYYDPLTTGDSSLSVCIQSIMAREVGLDAKARQYLSYAALMDYADIGGNVNDGCHIASMGGTWMAVVHGLSGFRDYDGSFSFAPRVPGDIESVSFRLTLRGCLLAVELSQEQATYSLLEGETLAFQHEGEKVELVAGTPASLPITRRRAAA
ncbi:MAG: glycoside hydrolase family 65 protein [Deltaproteobacteria bacterium]|nr:glycoside hydrolase family 65 protein [Deltaproteobacteria bacterium]